MKTLKRSNEESLKRAQRLQLLMDRIKRLTLTKVNEEEVMQEGMQESFENQAKKMNDLKRTIKIS